MTVFPKHPNPVLHKMYGLFRFTGKHVEGFNNNYYYWQVWNKFQFTPYTYKIALDMLKSENRRQKKVGEPRHPMFILRVTRDNLPYGMHVYVDHYITYHTRDTKCLACWFRQQFVDFFTATPHIDPERVAHTISDLGHAILYLKRQAEFHAPYTYEKLLYHQIIDMCYERLDNEDKSR